jgi:hypothetical protein
MNLRNRTGWYLNWVDVGRRHPSRAHWLLDWASAGLEDTAGKHGIECGV